MHSSLIVAALAFADSAAKLPDPLPALAKSAEAFASSIDTLEKETHAVVDEAALVHKVSANKTDREAVLKYMGERLEAGMPSQRSYDRAEEAAVEAADAYKRADLKCKQADLALLHARAALGGEKQNLTAKDDADLEQLRNASLAANADCAAAQADLEKKVAEAEKASAELLEKTKAYAEGFRDHVAELMHAAHRREAEAKDAMGAAIAEGQAAAQSEMQRRQVDEQTGEEDRLKAEMWAESKEKVIETASDHAGDDLHRIYKPVQHLVHKSIEAAEHQAKERHARLQHLLGSRDRLALVELHGAEDAKKLPPNAPAWLPWAAGLALVLSTSMLKHCCCCKHRSAAAAAKHGAAAGSALFLAATRGHDRAGLQQPLLAEQRV